MDNLVEHMHQEQQGSNQLLPAAGAGVDAGSVERLPRNSSSSSGNADDNNQSSDGEICAICRESLDNGRTLCKSDVCQHHFHFECLIKWVRKRNSTCTCPLCQRTVTKLSHGEGAVAIASFLGGAKDKAGTGPADGDYVEHEHEHEEDEEYEKEDGKDPVDACAVCGCECDEDCVDCYYCRNRAHFVCAGR